jgi:hypothetical protein
MTDFLHEGNTRIWADRLTVDRGVEPLLPGCHRRANGSRASVRAEAQDTRGLRPFHHHLIDPSGRPTPPQDVDQPLTAVA